jgi:hypothetical protein
MAVARSNDHPVVNEAAAVGTGDLHRSAAVEPGAELEPSPSGTGGRSPGHPLEFALPPRQVVHATETHGGLPGGHAIGGGSPARFGPHSTNTRRCAMRSRLLWRFVACGHHRARFRPAPRARAGTTARAMGSCRQCQRRRPMLCGPGLLRPPDHRCGRGRDRYQSGRADGPRCRRDQRSRRTRRAGWRRVASAATAQRRRRWGYRQRSQLSAWHHRLGSRSWRPRRARGPLGCRPSRTRTRCCGVDRQHRSDAGCDAT